MRPSIFLSLITVIIAMLLLLVSCKKNTHKNDFWGNGVSSQSSAPQTESDLTTSELSSCPDSKEEQSTISNAPLPSDVSSDTSSKTDSVEWQNSVPEVLIPSEVSSERLDNAVSSSAKPSSGATGTSSAIGGSASEELSSDDESDTSFSENRKDNTAIELPLDEWN